MSSRLCIRHDDATREIAAIAGLPFESNECGVYGSPVCASVSRFVPVFKMLAMSISAHALCLVRTILETGTNGPRRARTGLAAQVKKCREQLQSCLCPGFSGYARFKNIPNVYRRMYKPVWSEQLWKLAPTGRDGHERDCCSSQEMPGAVAVPFVPRFSVCARFKNVHTVHWRARKSVWSERSLDFNTQMSAHESSGELR